MARIGMGPCHFLWPLQRGGSESRDHGRATAMVFFTIFTGENLRINNFFLLI